MVDGGGADAVLIRVVPETGSTNADMLALAAAGTAVAAGAGLIAFG